MGRYTNASNIMVKGVQALGMTKYPEIPLSENDLYVFATVGDRYDIMASRVYNDSTLWWVIAAANPDLGMDSLIPPTGAQIRIPGNIQTVLQLFTLTNTM